MSAAAGPTVPGGVWRLLVLVVVSALCALTALEFSAESTLPLRVGDVAERTVRAPFTFTFEDEAAYEEAREAAAAAELPVYVLRTDVLEQRQERIRAAFRAGRAQWSQLGASEGKLTNELELLVVQAFLEPLGVQLPEEDVLALAEQGFRPEAEELAGALLSRALRDTTVVLSRDQLPTDHRPVTVIRISADGARSEEVLSDLDAVLVPETARQRVSLGLVESTVRGPDVDAAADLARALVTPNLTFDVLETSERRAAAADSVPMEERTVKRGQSLLVAGQVVSEADLRVYSALQEHQGGQSRVMQVTSLGVFLAGLLAALYQFGAAWIPGFSTRVRDVAAAGGLLWLVMLAARLVVASSDGVAAGLGFDVEGRSVWFAVPAAGAVMLVRLLLGVPWTVPFAIAAAVACAIVMDFQVLMLAYFLVGALAAAGGLDHTRERIAVVKVGAVVGVTSALAALALHLVELFHREPELSLASTVRPFWSMAFAFGSGLGSAFLVLGLVPLFEAAGFVTDYRLMELANLNHPLLRQLMLRAPGSYHHSVVVGTLAEAGAEAIGANALVSKVAAYFHDLGKALKPGYFVENQGGVNRHAELDPLVSAQIIIGHVVEGGRLAVEHGLPQPIVDNIYMHHGDGVLQFFLAEARARAADPESVDVAAFRYPGPKPNTREAGVIMLADKVEAATRTLRVPDEGNIRAMIGRIVNSVVADGQFTECPLTLQEIHTVTETFVRVLLGIYHQRVEYPQTADLSRAAPSGPAPALHPAAPAPAAPAPAAPDRAPAAPAVAGSEARPRPQAGQSRPPAAPQAVDYEAVDFLPTITGTFRNPSPPKKWP